MEHSVQPNCLKQKLSKPFVSQCSYLLCVSGRHVFVDCVVYWTSGWHCERAHLCVFSYRVVWFAINRIHDNGDEDAKVKKRPKYYCYREDREFWWDTWEIGNLRGTGGTVFFFSKQHQRGPPSANHIKLDRKQNVHIVEGSSFTS